MIKEMHLQATMIGKIAEQEVGITTLVKLCNTWRRSRGLSKVKSKTIQRYNNGKDTQGYMKTPVWYRKFLVDSIALY